MAKVKAVSREEVRGPAHQKAEAIAVHAQTSIRLFNQLQRMQMPS
jgi:hypothetical protein